jgi:hypothetical protein
VPIPYPVNSFASDTTDGSKTVNIGDKEIMLKDKSYYKKCTGDEAATKTLGMGVINASLSGKVYFISWSMDVEVEGENVVRHLDMTTSNHASPIANQQVPIPGVDKMSKANTSKCAKVIAKMKRHGSGSCPPGQQSHHPAQNACFESSRGVPAPTTPKYNTLDAPAVCLDNSYSGSIHYDVTQAQNNWAKGLTKPPTYSDLRKKSKQTLKTKAGMSEQEAECTMKVVDAYMKTIGVGSATTLRAPG